MADTHTHTHRRRRSYSGSGHDLAWANTSPVWMTNGKLAQPNQPNQPKSQLNTYVYPCADGAVCSILIESPFSSGLSNVPDSEIVPEIVPETTDVFPCVKKKLDTNYDWIVIHGDGEVTYGLDTDRLDTDRLDTDRLDTDETVANEIASYLMNVTDGTARVGYAIGSTAYEWIKGLDTRTYARNIIDRIAPVMDLWTSNVPKYVAPPVKSSTL